MSESAVLSARLIGEIFVERGLITSEQLEEAVAQQQVSGEMIGEVLVGSFGVSRIELASVLADQWAAMEREARERDAGTPAPTPAQIELAAAEAHRDDQEDAERRPIGEIFVERGMATEVQLEQALEEQRQTGERLGEILVRRGVIQRLELAGALAEQWSGLQKIRPPAPKKPEPWHEAALASPAPAASAAATAPPANLGPLQESVATLQRQVTALASRPDPDLTVLRGETRAVEARLADVEERLAATAGADAVADLGAALAELRTAVESQAEPAALAEAVSALAARVDALGVGELAVRVEAIEHAVGSFDQVGEEISRIDVLARAAARAEDVESIAGEVAGLRDETVARVDELAARLDRLVKQVDELGVAGVAAPGAADAGHLDELRASLEDLRERLDALAASVDERLGATAEGLGLVDDLRLRTEESLNALAERVESVERGLSTAGPSAEHDERLARLAETVGDLDARIAGLAGADDLAGVRGDLEQRRHGAADALDALTARVEAFADARDDDLHAALDHLRSRVDELVAAPAVSVDDVRAEAAAALGDRMAALDEQLARAWAELEGRATRTEVLAESERLTADLVALRGQLEALATDDSGRLAVDGALDRLAALEERTAHLEGRAAVTPEEAEALRVRVEDLARSLMELGDARGDLPDPARIDALAEALGELDSRLGSLQARVDENDGTGEALAALRAGVDERVDGLATVVDELRRAPALPMDLAERVSALASAVEELRAARVEPSALEERISGLTASVEELRRAAREQQSAAHDETFTALVARVDELAQRLHSEDVERRALEDDLRARVEAVQARAERIAGAEEEARADLRATLHDELLRRVQELAADERVDSLSEAVETLRAELGDRFDRLVPQESLDALAHAFGQRFDVLEHRLAATPGQDALDALVADLGERLTALGAVAHEAATRAGGVTEAVHAALDQRVEGLVGREELEQRTAGLLGRDELEQRTAGLVGRDELDERTADLVGRGELEQRTVGLVGREELDERTAGLVGRDELEQRTAGLVGREELEQRTAGLVGRDELDERTADLAGRAELEQRTAGLVGRDELEQRTAGLVGRDELDERTAGLVGREELDERTAGLVGREELDERTAGLVDREELEQRAAGLVGRKELEKRTAGLVDRDELEQRTAGLVGRDELEQRTAGLVGRDELEQRLYETATAGTEVARQATASVEALTIELREALAQAHRRIDELAAGLGHASGRLASVEQAVADDERLHAVAVDVAALRDRVDHEAALAEERAAASERAIRKGLAGLGERLVAGEQAYLEAGSALRRSLERLGAAVVEVDARIGDEPLDPPAQGYVAFLPTADGYRLRALEGVAPVIDAVVQAEVDGPWFRVVRTTVSPLPLDRRTCVYLEPA